MDPVITILGGGPAGSAAAIAARREGRKACVVEKSNLPRHKVCGEFFSPEIQLELEQLGMWDAFLAAGPARIRRMKLHFGRTVKSCRLPQPAWGLSRYTFDALLASDPAGPAGDPSIIASGRQSIETRGKRLFGFKAHFEGPTDDAVELFFFRGCYVGITAIEGGRTNVCGLGPEDYLKRLDFNFDRLLQESPLLQDRTKMLNRSMRWISTGPLRFAQTFRSDRDVYLAGDALSFVDPFTGSGLLAAVKTGAMAGKAAAHHLPTPEYYASSRRVLKRPFEVAGVFRKAVSSGWAEWIADLLPGRMLVALTRPK